MKFETCLKHSITFVRDDEQCSGCAAEAPSPTRAELATTHRTSTQSPPPADANSELLYLREQLAFRNEASARFLDCVKDEPECDTSKNAADVAIAIIERMRDQITIATAIGTSMPVDDVGRLSLLADALSHRDHLVKRCEEHEATIAWLKEDVRRLTADLARARTALKGRRP